MFCRHWTVPVNTPWTCLLCFVDTGLVPYTDYQYSLVAVNGAGRTKTSYSTATTQQTLPEGVTAPTATVEADQLDTIYLTWKTPTALNGQLMYCWSDYENTHAYICTQAHIHIHTHTKHTHMCAHIHMCVHTHTRRTPRTRTHTHTHTHTHTQIFS